MLIILRKMCLAHLGSWQLFDHSFTFLNIAMFIDIFPVFPKG